MNGYERRKREREMAAGARRKVTREFHNAENLIKAHQLIQRYEEAYSAYYKRTCKVTYSTGWFTVHNRKVRAMRLEEMAQKLEALIHEQNMRHPEEL